MAQTQTPTQRIQEAMTPLRDYNAAWIQVSGTETLGTVQTPIQTDIYWDTPTTKSFVEILSQNNGVINQRLVGDGVSLWAYSPARNEYSANIYGAYTGPQPQTYRSNLLSSITHLLKGTSAYGGRLLNEVYGGEAALYRSWVPINGEPTVYENGTTYTNPLNGRQYTSIPTQRDFIVYELGNPLRRAVIFERLWGPLRSGVDGWKLASVSVAEYARLGNRDRFIDVRVIFNGGGIPTTANFSFQPPAGSKSLTGPRPVGG
jgi:hypothetical protein